MEFLSSAEQEKAIDFLPGQFLAHVSESGASPFLCGLSPCPSFLSSSDLAWLISSE